MSDGEFYGYIALLALGGVALAVMAAAGFGQARSARIADAVLAAGFLGYAGYLAIASPSTVTVFFYAFAVPILAVVNVIRSRRPGRGGPLPAPMPYAAPSTQTPGAYPPAPEYGQQVPGFPPPPSFPLPPAPTQPGRPESPTVDPGTYRSMPSGLAGHENHEQAMPSGRPSGLPAAVSETFPMAPAAPAAPGSRPSGLPRRIPAGTEPPAPQSAQPAAYPASQSIAYPAAQPIAHATTEPVAYATAQPTTQPTTQPAAHVEFTQRMELPSAAPVRDEPAGPQPVYPAHPGTQQAQRWQSDLTQQFPAVPSDDTVDERYVQGYQHAAAPDFEQAQAAHAEYEQVGRHGYQEQPVAGRHWQQDPEPFTQPSYRPAHGEQQPAYPQEPEEAHPAEWPPYPR